MPDDSEENNHPVPLTETLVPIAMAPHPQSALIPQVSEPQLPHSYPAVTMPYPPPQACLPLPSSDVAAAASGFISPSTSVVRLIPLTSKSAATATPSTVNQAPSSTPLSESAAAAALSTSILPSTSTTISTTLGSSAAAAVAPPVAAVQCSGMTMASLQRSLDCVRAIPRGHVLCFLICVQRSCALPAHFVSSDHMLCSVCLCPLFTVLCLKVSHCSLMYIYRLQVGGLIPQSLFPHLQSPWCSVTQGPFQTRLLTPPPPSAVTNFHIRIPRPTIAPPQPPGLPVTKDLEMLESRNDIAPNPSSCNTDTNSVTPGHQPTLDSNDNIRPRRTRKVNILNLNACICGVTITEHEIQNSEAIMKCWVLGCETVWVSELWLLSK